MAHAPVSVVSYERLFAELLGAFQILADQHDQLRSDHEALQAEVTALTAQIKAQDAAELAAGVLPGGLLGRL